MNRFTLLTGSGTAAGAQNSISVSFNGLNSFKNSIRIKRYELGGYQINGTTYSAFPVCSVTCETTSNYYNV